MKTKFIKKLSFVLVVAMVLSLLVPATGAFAASAKLNSTKKYLHLGREESGENEFNFNVKNKQKGWKYAWESNDEDVVEVNAKNGVVTATGVGKTKVTVLITDEDGEEVDTLSATVTVRDNIETVAVKNPVEKLTVNEEHDYNRSFETESGSTKKTDSITRWEVVPAEGASIDDKGVFVATAAGEYTITARSFQSKARYNAWDDDAEKYADYVLATAETKVVVGATMVEAKQANLSKVNVTFDSAMEDVAKNISIYQIVGTTKVKQTIAKVEMDDDKKVASVSLYIPFTTGATYQVEYTGMDAVSFVAATTKAEDVASMTVHTATAVVNEEKTVEIKLFNADGVEITTPTLLTRVTIKAGGEAGTWYNSTTNKILIWEVGKTSVITATYNTYKYDNAGNPIGNIEAVGTIVGVDKDTTNITGLNAWTIVASGPNFGDVKQILAADDYGKKLFVKLDNKTASTPGNVDNTGVNAGRFEFTSSDQSVLIIDNAGNLYPVKEGVVTIVVKYAVSGDKVPVATVTLTVGPKKAATNFTLSTYEFSLSNTLNLGGTGDKLDVKLTMKDQANRGFYFNEYKIERLSGPIMANGNMTADQLTVSTPATGTISQASNADGELNVTFNANGKHKGTYVYKITVKDISRVVNINVLETNKDDLGNAVTAYYQLVLDSSAKDMKIESWTDLPVKVGIKLFGYTSNGVKNEDIDLATTTQFKVKVDAPYDSTGHFDDENDLKVGHYEVAKKESVTGVTGNVIFKAPVGSYKVSAFELLAGGVEKPLHTVYFTTSDTQTGAVLSDIKSQVYTNLLTDADISDTMASTPTTSQALITAVGGADNDNGLKFKVDGENVDIVSIEAVGNKDAFAVKSVTVRKLISGTAGNVNAVYLDYKVNVGLNFNKK